MTDAALAAFRTDARDVALAIYVDLISKHVSVAEGAVKTTANPEHLAKLSYKLAHAFLAVHDELNAANLPKDPTYKLGSDDIASWMK